MKIIVTNEDELYKVAAEAIHWLVNVRASEKDWKEQHGSKLLERKKYFEEKADEFLERLQVPKHRNLNELKIEIKDAD